jgi:hypothetical protein
MGIITRVATAPATQQWTPPGDLFRQFLVNAAIGAFASRNPGLYASAFTNIAPSLGGVSGVKNLQVPEPWMFTAAAADQDNLLAGLDFNVDTSEVLRGLYLLEYFLENPSQKAAFTPESYSAVARRIAGL